MKGQQAKGQALQQEAGLQEGAEPCLCLVGDVVNALEQVGCRGAMSGKASAVGEAEVQSAGLAFGSLRRSTRGCRYRIVANGFPLA